MTEALHVPDDFPHFHVQGHEDDMAALRVLFWKHFLPDGPAWDDWLNGPDLFPYYPILPSGSKTTLWDEWLCASMLWPAVESNGIRERMQARWRKSLGTRAMDSEGYVTTNNGASYAHQFGWPFPTWSHGTGGYGWHFSFKGQLGELGTPNGMAYRPPRLCNQDGWQLNGASDQGIDDCGWHLTLTGSDATADTPLQSIDTFQAPFLQMRWNATQWAGEDPYVEWASDEMPEFSASRRVYFDPPYAIYLPAGRWRMWRLLTGAREWIQCPDIESGIASVDWSNTSSIRFHMMD